MAMENYNTQNNYTQPSGVVEEEGTELSLRAIWKFFIGNWFWFVISVFGKTISGTTAARITVGRAPAAPTEASDRRSNAPERPADIPQIRYFFPALTKTDERISPITKITSESLTSAQEHHRTKNTPLNLLGYSSIQRLLTTVLTICTLVHSKSTMLKITSNKVQQFQNQQ